MVGQTISHYNILEKLGEGGMGIVYKAHDAELDRAVALKFLPRYLTSDAMEKERFYHEARAASSLNHPNVTTIYEIKEFEGQLFLAMEYVEGTTLKKLATGDPLAIKKVLDIAIQACDGLAAAHEKKIVHRDIKSDNIMITSKGQVKIMDFGLAKVKGATKLTKAGSTLGTAAYMSPEQAQGEDVDHRSDIFSFGVVLYELLTGHLPFRGDHQAALMYSLINEAPQPIARFNDKVSPALERIVDKALAKERDERYQHIDDLLADLRRERKGLEYARAGYATTTTMPQMAASPAAARAPGRPVRRYILVAAGLVAAVIALAIFNPFNFQFSTQTSTASQAKRSLAVIYFENIPDPEDKDHTGEMLTNLLTTSLFQTREIEVISRERLYDIQKELGQDEAKTISPTMATRVAERAGVTMMLLGSILQRQPELAVTYRLVEVQSGKILSTQRLSGFSTDKIFALVDTLAFLVKNDLDVRPSAQAEGASVASVTTSSPEAYRAYLEGVQLNRKYFSAEAKAAFKRAIELDSTFAMAYFGLATLAVEPDAELQRTALIRAWQLADRTTEKERLTIQATYALRVKNAGAEGVRLLEEFAEKYPHEQDVYNALAQVFRAQAQTEKSIEAIKRGLQNDPRDDELWNGLGYAYAAAGRRAEAIEAIDHYRELAPALPNPYDSKGEIYAMFGESDSAFMYYEKAVSYKADFPSTAKLGAIALTRGDFAAAENYFRQFGQTSDKMTAAQAKNLLALIPFRQGRLQEAELLLRRNLETFQSQRLLSAVSQIYDVFVLLAYLRHDYDAMVEYAEKLSALDEAAFGGSFRSRGCLALAHLKNGHAATYAKILDDMGKEGPSLAPRRRAAFEYTAAAGLFEQGKYEEALSRFEQCRQFLAANHLPPIWVGIAQLKRGRAKEAAETLSRVLRWVAVDQDGYTLAHLPVLQETPPVTAHYWLGVAYEQLGRKQEAAKEYEAFLSIWKEADFKSSELADARTRLAALRKVAAR